MPWIGAGSRRDTNVSESLGERGRAVKECSGLPRLVTKNDPTFFSKPWGMAGSMQYMRGLCYCISSTVFFIS